MASVSKQAIYPLQKKLLKTFLPIALVPLAVLGTIGTFLTYRQTTQQANIKLHERSVFAAELTHRELKDALSFLQATAMNPMIQVAAKTGTEKAKTAGLDQQPIEQVENQFAAAKVLPVNAFLPSYFRDIAAARGFSELIMTEEHGFNVAYSHITTDFVQRDEDWWKNGRILGQWIGVPEYDVSSQTTAVSIVQEIKDSRTQEFLGVLKGSYSIKNLDFLAKDLQALHLNDTEYVQIVSSSTEPQVVATITAAGTSQANSLMVEPTLIREAILRLKNQENASAGNTSRDALEMRTVSINRGHYQYSFAQVPETDWLIISSACIYEIHVVETHWLLLFGGALLGLGVVSYLMVSRFSRQLTEPLSQLAKGTDQVVQQADFSLRVPVTHQDEVGVLARSLNQLLAWSDDHTQALSQSQQQLEERTNELSKALDDLHQAQSQLVQTEKMSALGQLVAGIAHEINNPVSFIHGNLKYVENYTQDLLNFLSLYEEYYPNPAAEIQEEAKDIDLTFLKKDLNKTISSMKTGTERIREIVLSLRNFSRIDEAEYKAVDIHQGLESTLSILQHRLNAQTQRPAIAIIRDFDTIPPVECFAGQLNQVFMNVLSNAIDALDTKLTSTEITLESACSIGPQPPQIVIRTIARTDSVIISITDNGRGMSADVQARIFDPFFTTKGVGEGTGMGLATSYQLITGIHRGKIECFSNEGIGTEFIIEIPAKVYQPHRTQSSSSSLQSASKSLHPIC